MAGLLLIEQECEDLNPEPTVLETVALPVELHSYDEAHARYASDNPLFGLFIDDVLADDRIIFTQFKAGGRIHTILERIIHMTALRATHFYENTIAFFRHITPYLLEHIGFEVEASDGI